MYGIAAGPNVWRFYLQWCIPTLGNTSILEKVEVLHYREEEAAGEWFQWALKIIQGCLDEMWITVKEVCKLECIVWACVPLWNNLGHSQHVSWEWI